MYKVLFVCLGNICRSPLAEAIFKNQLFDKGLGHTIAADSCGIIDYHKGNLADTRTRKIARKYGIEITHKARKIEAIDFTEFDELIVMDEMVFNQVLELKPNHFDASKIKLLRNFDPLLPANAIPDPYYSIIEKFEEVHKMIARCTAAYLSTLKV